MSGLNPFSLSGLKKLEAIPIMLFPLFSLFILYRNYQNTKHIKHKLLETNGNKCVLRFNTVQHTRNINFGALR